jgi:adenylate kinase
VPDDITIPMILDRLKEGDAKNGWLLDGFPRNLAQAEALWDALKKENIKLDIVIEIDLDRETSKNRIMGRRLCRIDNNHPNNIYIDAIKPHTHDGKTVCQVCGCEDLSTRADDQDSQAIDKRHGIYYDTKTGTLAAVNFFRERTKVIVVNGRPGVKEVSEELIRKLG